MNIGKHIGTNWIVKEDSLFMMRSALVNRSQMRGIVDLSISFTGSFESGDHEKPIQNPYKPKEQARLYALALFLRESRPPDLLKIQPSQIINDDSLVRRMQTCEESRMNQE